MISGSHGGLSAFGSSGAQEVQENQAERDTKGHENSL